MNTDPIQEAFDNAETIGADDCDQPPPHPLECDDFDDPLIPEAAAFPLNDYGNGLRFGLYFGPDVVYVPRVAWFIWNGKLWEQDDDKLNVRALAQKVSGKITHEAGFLRLDDWQMDQIDLLPGLAREVAELEKIPLSERTDAQKARWPDLKREHDRADLFVGELKKLRKNHHNHARSAGNSGPIGNMILEAQVEAHRALDLMNADPLSLNTEAGVIQFFQEDPHDKHSPWRTRLVPHAREQYISKMMPVAYDPSATCPAWDEFMESILPDPELRNFMQRWFGYSSLGLTVEQKLAFLYGHGRNGKSTLVDIIARIMGPYATSVPIETLTGADTRKGSDATPDLVRLPGARMVRASEPEQGQKMKEATIKLLTGGEAILVRRMQQEFVEVTPIFKLTVQGNYKPDIRGTDDGIWRRVMLVPFEKQVALADVDKELSSKLWAEASGILNWLVKGALDWLENGLQEPQSVLDATLSYRDESDPVRVFLSENCTLGGVDDFMKSRDLISAFRWWQTEKGIDPWGKRTISNHFKAKARTYKCENGHSFYPLKRSDTGFIGIALTKMFKRHREETPLDDVVPDRQRPY